MASGIPTLCGIGPVFLDDAAYGTENDVTTGYDIVDYLSIRRLKTTSTGAVGHTSTAQGLTTMTKNYRWFVIHFRIEGTLNASQRIRILRSSAGATDVQIDRVSNSTFRLRVSNSGTTGSGTFNTSQDYTLVLEYVINGANWDMLCYMDGTLDLTAASEEANDPTAAILLNCDALQSGQTYYVWQAASRETDSDSGTDVPSGVVTAEQYEIAGNGTSDTLQKQATACGSSADGSFTEWDDWDADGTQDGNTTANKACSGHPLGGQSGTEISTLTAVNIADAENACAIVTGYVRAEVGAKVHTSYTRIADGSGNSAEVTNTNINSTTYGRRRSVFITNAAGLAWNQTRLDALRAGVRTVNTNTDAAFWTALGVEIITMEDAAAAALEVHVSSL